MRLVAVLVGLANLAVLAALNGVDAGDRVGSAIWEVLPPVLAVVVAGFVTSEIVLRWFKSLALAERFFARYGTAVFTLCFGGAIMGGMLVFVLILNDALIPGLPATPEQIVPALLVILAGAAFGLALGLAEGVILAFPLAVILGRFSDRS